MLSLDSGQFVPAPWHIVLCKPNRNHIAFRNLQRLGFDLFMPRHQVQRRWRGRTLSELRPVFAGYMFLGTGRVGTRWDLIRTTPGVAKLIGFGAEGPAMVPGEFVAGLMHRCDAEGLLQPDPHLTVGDRVRIVSGPFADFVTTIDRIDAEKRIHVLLNLLGGKTKISLDCGMVTRIVS